MLIASQLSEELVCALQCSIEEERTFIMGLEVRARFGVVRLAQLSLLAPIDLVFTPHTEMLRLILPIMPWTCGGVFVGPHAHARYVLHGKK